MNDARRPRLNSKHQNISRFNGSEGAPVLASACVNLRIVDPDLSQSFPRYPCFPQAQLHEIEASATVVVHYENGLLPGPDAKICSVRERLESCSHLRPRRARRPFENTLKIAASAVQGSETKRLSQLNHFISRVLLRCCAANRTDGRSSRLHIDCLARAAESDRVRRSQRIGLFHCKASLRPVMHDTHGRMNQSVLNCFSARRELADRQVQVAVNHALLRRPVVTPRRAFVKEIAYARRKPEHGKQAHVGEPLAQRVLNEQWIVGRRRYAAYKLMIDEGKQCRALCHELQIGVRQQDIGGAGNRRLIALDPSRHRLFSRRPWRAASLSRRQRLVPLHRVSEFTVYAVRCLSAEKIECLKCLSQDFFGEHPLNYFQPRHINIWLRGRVCGHALRTLKIIIVMAAATAQSQRNREAGSAAACAADPLLVVETHRRHVGHHDGQEPANIHTRFHRCGDTQKIDGICPRILNAWQYDILKEPLTPAAVGLVRLAREFLAVEAEEVFRLR